MRMQTSMIPLLDVMFAAIGVFLLLFSVLVLQAPPQRESRLPDLFLLLQGNGDQVRVVAPHEGEWRLRRPGLAAWVAERAHRLERPLGVVLATPATAIRGGRSLADDLYKLSKKDDGEDGRRIQIQVLWQALAAEPDAENKLLEGWMRP